MYAFGQYISQTGHTLLPTQQQIYWRNPNKIALNKAFITVFIITFIEAQVR